MKNISEIDLTKYRTFAYTDLEGDFDIYVKTLGGDVKVESGFEIFSVESGSIVAFDHLCVYGFHDCILKQNNNIRHIELTEYENMKYVLEEKPEYKFAFYIFTKSGEVPASSLFHPDAKFKNTEIEQSTFKRCDFGKYGGIAFEYGRNPYNIAKVFNLLNLSGVGHIVRLEVLDDWYKDTDTHGKYTAALTVSGMLKLIDDWAYVNQPPFNNNEEISNTARMYIDSLGIPKDVMDEIRTLQPQSVMEYYLSGGEDRYFISEEKLEMPPKLKNFILSKCRYKSLNSLKMNHPNNINIPQEILDKELHMYNLVIFQYCIYYGLDSENIEISEIKKTFSKNTEDIGLVYPIHEAIDRIGVL